MLRTSSASGFNVSADRERRDCDPSNTNVAVKELSIVGSLCILSHLVLELFSDELE